MDRYERETFTMEAILKQLELADIPKSVLEEHPTNWNKLFSISHTAFTLWKEWFLVEFRKRFGGTRKAAQIEFSEFSYTYRLSNSCTAENSSLSAE